MSDEFKAYDGRDLGAFIPSALDDYGLDPYEFRVYAHIVRRAGSGKCWSGIDKIANYCKMGNRKVKDAIALLVGTGMIRKEYTQGKSSELFLTPQSQWVHPEMVDEIRERVMAYKYKNTPRCQEPTHPGARNLPTQVPGTYPPRCQEPTHPGARNLPTQVPGTYKGTPYEGYPIEGTPYEGNTPYSPPIDADASSGDSIARTNKCVLIEEKKQEESEPVVEILPVQPLSSVQASTTKPENSGQDKDSGARKKSQRNKKREDAKQKYLQMGLYPSLPKLQPDLFQEWYDVFARYREETGAHGGEDRMECAIAWGRQLDLGKGDESTGKAIARDILRATQYRLEYAQKVKREGGKDRFALKGKKYLEGTDESSPKWRSTLEEMEHKSLPKTLCRDWFEKFFAAFFVGCQYVNRDAGRKSQAEAVWQLKLQELSDRGEDSESVVQQVFESVAPYFEFKLKGRGVAKICTAAEYLEQEFWREVMRWRGRGGIGLIPTIEEVRASMREDDIRQALIKYSGANPSDFDRPVPQEDLPVLQLQEA